MQRHHAAMRLSLHLTAALCLSALTAQAAEAQAVRGRFALDLGPVYSRVEGLPISIGPIVETVEDRPWRFQGIVVVRPSDISFLIERVGFRARAEKYLLDDRAFRVGVAGWSEVVSPEDRGLSNLEASLSAFGFHDDRRDYFESAGGSAYVIYTPPESPFRAGVEVQVEQHSLVSDGGPESIFDNNQPWRPLPLVAEGRLQSAIAIAQYDTRPADPDGPFNGWLMEAQVRQGLGGTLENFEVTDANGALVPGGSARTDFTKGNVDIRRYNAFGDLGLNFRLLAGGSLTGGTLPAQFQSAPGGAGTLPGHELLEIDCGAHATTVIPTRSPVDFSFNPFYGCDQFVLIQAQAEGYFGFRIGRDRSEARNPWEAAGIDFELVPMWALFFNAGRGWASSDNRFTTTDEDWAYDVGGGVMLGALGLYGAYPLTGEDKTVKFVVRLQRRL